MTPARFSPRAALFLFWTAVSTVLYGIAVLAFSPISKRVARWIGDQWCKQLLFVAGIRVTVTGKEYLDPSGRYIVIANHSSHLDIPILMALFPVTLHFMAKKELFRIPFFGWGIRAMGHIAVDRSNPRNARKAISKAVEQMRTHNISVVLFPEGTRTTTGRIGEFKQASLALAVEAGMPVLPVLLSGSYDALPKKTWAVKPARVRIQIAQPIPGDAVAKTDRKQLAQNVRAILLSMQKKQR